MGKVIKRQTKKVSMKTGAQEEGNRVIWEMTNRETQIRKQEASGKRKHKGRELGNKA